jgi:hypothetical protein
LLQWMRISFSIILSDISIQKALQGDFWKRT